MRIRAESTASVFDGTQIHVFNAGKEGEPGPWLSLDGPLRQSCMGTGKFEEEDAIPQLDHDGDGAPGGSEPHDPPALTGKNKAALLEIASAEGVIVPEGATNKEIVDLIESVRSGEMVFVDGDHGEEAPPA